MSKDIFSIGYEGAKIEQFIATLKEVGVTCVADTRDVPVSRKKGFSKTKLADHLQEEGIGYLHFKALGDPKPGRVAARAGDYDEFRRIFSAHLKTDDAQAALQELASCAEDELVCLLCFERNHQHCHRSMVAEGLKKNYGFNVVHIGVRLH